VTAPEHRYTDRDVRECPELVAAAEGYLRAYTGEFQFLVDAQRSLVSYGQPLPVAITRGVLNCMRADVRLWGTLPAPLPPEPKPRRLKVVEEPRRWPFRLKTRWKKSVLVSLHASAQVWHVFSPERSYIEYVPARDEYRVYMHGLCAWYAVDGTTGYRTPAALLDAPPADRRQCAACTRLQEQG
jgi:hypothetical protein